MNDQIKEHLEDESYTLLFAVRRSIRYHIYRRRFFDTFSNTVTAFSVILGAATVGTTLSTLYKNYTLFTGVAMTILSTLNLVLRITERARLHAELSRKFIELEKDMVSAESLSEALLRKWTAQRLTIEAEEPPVKRVLDSICHNELVRAEGCEESEEVRIGWVQRLFSQFIDLWPHTIKKKQLSASNPPSIPPSLPAGSQSVS